MLRERLSTYRDRARRELTTAMTAEYTPHEIALSFAIGLFVTAMPTGGLGIGLLLGLAYWQAWASKAAMIAAIAVLNPLVKPAVYVASYQLGAALLGSELVVSLGHPTLDLGLEIVQFLLFGNLVIALLLAALGYVAVFRVTVAYRQRQEQVSPGGAWATLSVFGRRKR
ncbi:DUF2062 domain-containing protein [Halobacteria archaeon AArc-dxtr1]|nr:DUF2062 domain-containing protein [Halobacteria archaeon AArc-dxtr1]